MAEATSELSNLNSTPNFLPGMNNLGVFKQLGLMIGLAASVALGVFLVLWGSEPNMRPLGQMDPATSLDVVSYLEQSNVQYKIDGTGNILVEQDSFQRIKMELAGQGVMVGSQSDQLLDQESGFGVSQRLEQARLQRTQELTLAKTISDFSGVRAAKVHLALPKETAFLKHRRKPSASVLLNLYRNQTMDSEQVRAIVDLVTGSVPSLEASKVTVTDQFGRLLHSGSQTDQERETNREMKLIREQQADYRSKIEEILLPIVGEGNFTVQVNVDMDFTKKEQTQQIYNPEQPAIRSERTLEDSSNSASASGVPGALSNQPPAAANIPEQLQQQNAQLAENQSNGNKRLEAERNYDLDTTISHIRQQVGQVKQVSVSVGLDYVPDAQDNNQLIPRAQEQVDDINRLIRGAIGFNANRGDRVEIESFRFVRPERIPDPAPLAFYEQPIFEALWKPVTALLLGLLLIFGLLKPLMNKLTTQPHVPIATPDEDDLSLGMGDDKLSLEHDSTLELPGPSLAGSPKGERAKAIAGNDPTMVAQLVRNWVEEDE
ncbi:flagellar basal-body MS-ring/collar protein FliF [Pleionea litopenaei]|uniref:Flagellar M-ring protein n=1 Tax=Pleionea litopenaei TaxID=3070815 RepID=A0AA51RU19_9GAMM|nr:flagellar basal-body MS-ring/collar protein FliF [Pleionea sp. HL-JVS1]WMS87663.1 flagellar basal-body MS-ring/collar protein FliF [Pleionea sp. HL-JVS1]